MEGALVLHELVGIHEPLVAARLVTLLRSLLALQLLRPLQYLWWRLIDRKLVVSGSYHFGELISGSLFRGASFGLHL